MNKPLEKLLTNEDCAKDIIWQLEQIGLNNQQAKQQYTKKAIQIYQQNIKNPNYSFTQLIYDTCDKYTNIINALHHKIGSNQDIKDYLTSYSNNESIGDE